MRFKKLSARDTRPAPTNVRKEKELRKRRASQKIFTIAVMLLIGVSVVYWIWNSQWIETRGRVVSHTVAIGATKTGRVSHILVSQGEAVVKGQTVISLDKAALQARLNEANAQLAEYEVELSALRNMGVKPTFKSEVLESESERYDIKGEARNVQAHIDALEIDLEQAEINMDRSERLFLLRVITRPEWEAAASRYRSLRAQISVLKTKLDTTLGRANRLNDVLTLTRANLQREQLAHQAEIDQLAQQVEQARQRVQAISADIELTDIVAPRDGVVRWIYAESGEVVDHNDTLLALVDDSERWIEAYVEADDLGYIKAGQHAHVRFTGFIGGSYDGRVVEYVSRYENLKAKPRVGPDQVRTPLRLGRVAHPVRIAIDEPLNPEIRSEMIASVRIKK